MKSIGQAAVKAIAYMVGVGAFCFFGYISITSGPVTAAVFFVIVIFLFLFTLFLECD